MSNFAQAQTCRRQVLLHYFGEYREKECGNCDVCIDPPKSFNGTEAAQKALSCVYRVNQSFGIGYVTEVLRGMQNIRIRENGHDKLSTYGIGREHSHDYWVSIMRQLVHKGLLSQNITRNSTLQLTPEARPILRGEVELELAVPRWMRLLLSLIRCLPRTTTRSCLRNCATCARNWRMKQACHLTWCLVMQPLSTWRISYLLHTVRCWR